MREVVVEGRRKGVKQDERPLNEVENYLLGTMDLTPEVVKGNLKDFYHRMGDMESDNNPNASAKSSSAKGVYQYLNGNKKNGLGSSFQVALNRTKRAYEKAGFDAPSWIDKAHKHEDPRKLTQEQSDTLMLSDLLLGPKPVSAPLTQYLINGQTQPKHLHDVYKEHHTDVTNTAEQGDVIGRMNERLGIPL